MDKKIEQILYSMGLTPNYKGYRQLAQVLQIAVEEPEALEAVTKRLYPAAARKCGTNWKAVERNIRTMIGIAWQTAPEQLERLSGYCLERRPRPAQFLAFLTYHLSRIQ